MLLGRKAASRMRKKNKGCSPGLFRNPSQPLLCLRLYSPVSYPVIQELSAIQLITRLLVYTTITHYRHLPVCFNVCFATFSDRCAKYQCIE